MLARGQKVRTTLSLVRDCEWRENPKGGLDRRLKVCAKDNLCTNESELCDNPLSVRIGHATNIIIYSRQSKVTN